MPNVGGLLAKKNVSTYGTYYLMTYDWKHLSQGVGKLRKDVKSKVADVKNHNIEKIQKDMGKIDNEIKNADMYGSKFGKRDLFLFRKSVLVMRILARSVKSNLGKLKFSLLTYSERWGETRSCMVFLMS